MSTLLEDWPEPDRESVARRLRMHMGDKRLNRKRLAMAAGLFVGAWLGAMFVGSISPLRMKQIYGLFLLSVGLYFLFAPSGFNRKSPAPTPPAATQHSEEGQ